MNVMSVIFYLRLENNEKLMRLQKEIQEQKSKKERAQRELKAARQAAKSKIDNPDYFTSFEVNIYISFESLQSK